MLLLVDTGKCIAWKKRRNEIYIATKRPGSLKLIFSIAALLFANAFAVGQTANVAIIHHNIHSGGQPQAAADHIINLMELTPQKMLVLCNEANYARQYFDFSYAGWHSIWPSSPHEGRGNPIFVRDAAATMMASWKLVMTESWTHLQPKDPRVYTAVKCELVGNPWVQFHCINVHFPTNRDINEPARQESIDALIQASQDMPKLPLIICGDFNMGEVEARRRIANPIGAKLYSNASVDHIILRDGEEVGFDTNVSAVRLGQFISDHQALRYNFTFKKLDVTRVPEWNLY
jgi:hypothetical protein